MSDVKTVHPQWSPVSWLPVGLLRSDQLDALAAALSAAQGKFEAVSKNANNPFFKSKYADLPAVVAAATPILAEFGLSVWQGIGYDDQGDTLSTVVLHSSGQYLGSTMRLRPVKNDPQAQGSAVTYGKRYAYMAALGLVADVDDDAEGAMSRGGKSVTSQPASRPVRGKETRKTANGSSRNDGSSSRSEARSEAEDAPQGTSDGDSVAPVTDETLKALGDAYRAAGASASDLKSILKEVGASGTKTSDLSEDRAKWVVVKLGQIAKEKAA